MQRKLIYLQLLWVSILAHSASADKLDDILERGTIRIGVSEFMPWTFTNMIGDLEGFEIDVSRRIAYDIGVSPEYKVYKLDQMFDALNRGEIDFISAGLANYPRTCAEGRFLITLFFLRNNIGYE